VIKKRRGTAFRLETNPGSNPVVELYEFTDATNAGALMAQLTQTSDNKIY